jgi:hypothetical protein
LFPNIGSQFTSEYPGNPGNKRQLKPDQSDWSMDIFRRKLLRNKGKIVRIRPCWAWWCLPVIPVTGKLKQEDHELGKPGLHSEFQANLNYIIQQQIKIHS